MFINLLPPYTWGEPIQRACNDLKTAVCFRSINNPFVTIIIVKEKNLIGRTFAQNRHFLRPVISAFKLAFNEPDAEMFSRNNENQLQRK